MQKIAISGSSGFLGTNIKQYLKNRYEIVGISQELLYSPDNLAEFFKKENPDIIIHAAAYGNHSNQDNPAMTVFSNIVGGFNMMYASLHIPYKKFVLIGSSSEYGISDFPMRENDKCNPETFYGASKLGTTYLGKVFAKQYNKPIITIRPFSIYGEYEANFRFIPTVIHNLLKGTEMNLDTKGIHDWIYVEDFIEGMLKAIEVAPNGDIVNIGTGRQTTNLQIVQILENLSGLKLKYKEVNMRPNDSKNWSAEMSKLISWGFKTKYPLGLGLGKTLQYYKANG